MHTKIEDIRQIDLDAIEKQARALRAEVLRGWMASFKAFFAGLGENFGAGAKA